MKKIIAAAFLAGLAVQVSAQSGTNSPYSQYGLGALASQATSFNRGMNGLAYGFHEHSQVNYMTLLHTLQLTLFRLSSMLV